MSCIKSCLLKVHFYNYPSGCSCGFGPLSTTTSIPCIYKQVLLYKLKSGFDLNYHPTWCDLWSGDKQFKESNGKSA